MPASKTRFAADTGDTEKDSFTDPNGQNSSSLSPQEIDRFEDLDRGYIVLTPELVARRTRLRRVVAGIVGVAGFVSVLVGVHFVAQRSRSAVPPTPILAVQTVMASVDVSADTLPAPPAAAPHAEQAHDPAPAVSDAVRDAPAPTQPAAKPPAGKTAEAKGTAPKTPAAKPGGCTKDTQCKGDRVCTNGSCVDAK
jgi:hypothetical protein